VVSGLAEVVEGVVKGELCVGRRIKSEQQLICESNLGSAVEWKRRRGADGEEETYFALARVLVSLDVDDPRKVGVGEGSERLGDGWGEVLELEVGGSGVVGGGHTCEVERRGK
jgi:hypothetical protein